MIIVVHSCVIVIRDKMVINFCFVGDIVAFKEQTISCQKSDSTCYNIKLHTDVIGISCLLDDVSIGGVSKSKTITFSVGNLVE